jgi:hypothetical protein
MGRARRSGPSPKLNSPPAGDTARAMSEENVRSVRESYASPGALFATWAGRMAPLSSSTSRLCYPDKPVMNDIEELKGGVRDSGVGVLLCMESSGLRGILRERCRRRTSRSCERGGKPG